MGTGSRHQGWYEKDTEAKKQNSTTVTLRVGNWWGAGHSRAWFSGRKLDFYFSFFNFLKLKYN